MYANKVPFWFYFLHITQMKTDTQDNKTSVSIIVPSVFSIVSNGRKMMAALSFQKIQA